MLLAMAIAGYWWQETRPSAQARNALAKIEIRISAEADGLTTTIEFPEEAPQTLLEAASPFGRFRCFSVDTAEHLKRQVVTIDANWRDKPDHRPVSRSSLLFRR